MMLAQSSERARKNGFEKQIARLEELHDANVRVRAAAEIAAAKKKAAQDNFDVIRDS